MVLVVWGRQGGGSIFEVEIIRRTAGPINLSTIYAAAVMCPGLLFRSVSNFAWVASAWTWSADVHILIYRKF